MSSACPLLTDVYLDTNSLSQAECYQMYFPKIQCLYFQGGGPMSVGHETYEAKVRRLCLTLAFTGSIF